MDAIMTTELYWLTLTIGMTALFWVPYILNWIMEHGMVAALWNPKEYDHTQPKAAWALRMLRAHENAVENLVIFAPLVLILHAMEISTAATATASMVYFTARAAHFWVFAFAIPSLRVLTFLVGFGAQMVLVLTLLGII
ncbi:hypothetical protein MNBD_GAMMA13-652 [hydrothermal vent metagenome]|uniref:MAPEG family protein n=1 Tax=hydrothermal vent metagenome TaxID=652676 RepID=A0A3B0YPK9_9ZZZZ